MNRDKKFIWWITHLIALVVSLSIISVILVSPNSVNASTSASLQPQKLPGQVEKFLVLQRINPGRKARGLSPYGYNSILSDVAYQHNKLQYQNGTFSHQFPNEPNPGQRIWAKFPGHIPGENCWWAGGSITTKKQAIITANKIENSMEAEGPGTANNPTHYDMLFSHTFTQIGISVIYGTKGLALTEDFIS